MRSRSHFLKIRLIALLGAFLLVLAIISIAVASGDDLSDIDSAAAVPALDSAYAQIQVGFAALEPIWRKACYDCHSDKTDYPWYHSLPLVRGLIDSDIREARGELDMSTGFPFQSTREPVDDLRKIKDEVSKDAMPPWNYKLMHWSAGLSDEEKTSVFAWVDSSLAILSAHGVKPSNRGRGSETEAH